MTRFAAFASQLFTNPFPALLALSGVAYMLLAFLPVGTEAAMAEICGTLTIAELGQVFLSNPRAISPVSLAVDWGIMVIAMMTPLVSSQLAYVRRSVVSERRSGSTMAFLGAYWSVWCTSAFVIFPVAILMMTLTKNWSSLSVTLAISTIHSMTPLAQRARNACHLTIRISPFAIRAWVDSARQGYTTGIHCVSACWPWMMVPLSVVQNHMAMMVAVALYLFADRLAQPKYPTWSAPPALETLLGHLNIQK